MNNGAASRWLPAFALTIAVLVIAAIVFLYLHGSVRGDAAGLAGFRLGAMDAGGAESPINAAGAAARAGSTAASSDGEESPYQQAREEDLEVQRRMNEMAPDTPGVTPDDYVGEGDDSAFQTPEEEAAEAAADK